jgi:hypothetical protein
MYENKKLIKEEFNQNLLDATTSTIFLSANKSFLAKHLFNDSGDDNLEVFKGNKLEQI